MYPLAEAAGWSAAILAGLMPIPQAYRVWRVGAAGVSLVSWQFLFWAVAGWLGYGLVTGRPPIIVSNLLLTIFCGVTLRLVQRTRQLSTAEVWLWPCAAVVVGWLAGAAGGAMGFMSIMIVPALLSGLAQLETSVRADAAEGVSVASFGVVCSAQFLFSYYGLATDAPELVWANSVAGAISFLVVCVTLAKRLRGRRRLEASAEVDVVERLHAQPCGLDC